MNDAIAATMMIIRFFMMHLLRGLDVGVSTSMPRSASSAPVARASSVRARPVVGVAAISSSRARERSFWRVSTRKLVDIPAP